jgi:hypothetical protein
LDERPSDEVLDWALAALCIGDEELVLHVDAMVCLHYHLSVCTLDRVLDKDTVRPISRTADDLDVAGSLGDMLLRPRSIGWLITTKDNVRFCAIFQFSCTHLEVVGMLNREEE